MCTPCKQILQLQKNKHVLRQNPNHEPFDPYYNDDKRAIHCHQTARQITTLSPFTTCFLPFLPPPLSNHFFHFPLSPFSVSTIDPSIHPSIHPHVSLTSYLLQAIQDLAGRGGREAQRIYPQTYKKVLAKDDFFSFFLNVFSPRNY